MTERSRVRIPAGEFSSPGSTFCADSYFGIRSTPTTADSRDCAAREEPAVSKTFEPPKRSYADAAGNKVQTCMPAVQKKATVLAARALKTKAQKKSNSNEYRNAPPQQTGAETD